MMGSHKARNRHSSKPYSDNRKKDSISRHKTIELTVLARAISDQEAVDNAYQELSFDSIGRRILMSRKYPQIFIS